MAKPDLHEQLSLDDASVWDTAPGIGRWAQEFHRHIYLDLDMRRLAETYDDDGRKPVSPRLLTGVTLLQFMFGVSDREAVRRTLVDREWRVALGLGSEYEGFHPTVLVRFRDRLERAELEEELFKQVLAEAHRLGMLRGRRRLRVDATKLLADVSALSRGDVVRETLRVVVNALWKAAPELEGAPEFDRLLDRYGEESWLGGPTSRAALVELGRDGYALLALCEGRSVERLELLVRVLAENFVVEEGGPRPREPREMSSDRVRSPHDPDARLGSNRGKVWIGDKVHVIETADGDGDVIVGVLVTDPRQEDSTVLGEVRALGLSEVPEAQALLADTGYASVANTLASEAAGVDLVSPPRGSWRQHGYAPSEFEIDFEGRTARCPGGQECAVWHGERAEWVTIRWADRTCGSCPLHDACTKNRRGRQLHLAPHWERLEAERARARTREFREEYRHRAAVEATFSELVRRHGLRRSRYRGAPGRRLHAILSATGLNAMRVIRWALNPEADAIIARRLASCVARG